jgi:hypothetical protein
VGVRQPFGAFSLCAQFLPRADIEIIPVAVVEESIAAQAAGGLFKVSGTLTHA